MVVYSDPYCRKKLTIVKLRIVRRLSVMLYLSCLALAGLSEAQTLSKAADLKAEPLMEAKTVKVLAVNSTAKVLKRQGFWVEIDSGGLKGWVKLSNLSLGTSGGGGISTMDTGRTGTGNIVSTSAARGLSAEDLVAAKPDPLQFEQLKSLAVSATDAENFAQSRDLKIRSVPLLETPARPPSRASAPVSTDSARRKFSKSEDDVEDD